MTCFLYLRAWDHMLMVHDPKIGVCSSYFEFDENLISDTIGRETTPQHVVEYIHLYIYRLNSKKLLRAFDKGDGYDEACIAIRDAFDAYKKLDFEEKTRLHKKKLAELEADLRHEQAWALSII